MNGAKHRKVAIVTGGAKRLGAAIVRRLAANGYAVVIHANRSLGEAEELAASLRHDGHAAATVAGDLADLAALPAIITQADQPFGPLSLLVNNASTFDKDDIATLTPEGLAGAALVNLHAPILLAKAFAAGRNQTREGAIINLIDQRVLKPNPLFFSYSLAKSGLFWATRTLAQSLAPRIRVNAVGPGPTLPNIHEGSDLFNMEVGGTLLAQPVSPEAIAEAVHFLAEARHITGQMLAVDSGQHLGWKTPDIITD